MAKSILLARPHPFIVSEMKPLLERSGYDVVRPESNGDIGTIARQSAGAVISLALTSPLNLSAEEVLKVITQSAPRLPIIFAALLPFEKAQEALKELAASIGIQATVVGINSHSSLDTSLGKPTSFLYFTKDDLADPTRKQRAQSLIQRHFG